MRLILERCMRATLQMWFTFKWDSKTKCIQSDAAYLLMGKFPDRLSATLAGLSSKCVDGCDNGEFFFLLTAMDSHGESLLVQSAEEKCLIFMIVFIYWGHEKVRKTIYIIPFSRTIAASVWEEEGSLKLPKRTLHRWAQPCAVSSEVCKTQILDGNNNEMVIKWAIPRKCQPRVWIFKLFIPSQIWFQMKVDNLKFMENNTLGSLICIN